MEIVLLLLDWLSNFFFFAEGEREPFPFARAEGRSEKHRRPFVVDCCFWRQQTDTIVVVAVVVVTVKIVHTDRRFPPGGWSSIMMGRRGTSTKFRSLDSSK